MNKINDLRTFIKVLAENNQIEFIEKEVDWKYELGSALGTLQKYNKGAGPYITSGLVFSKSLYGGAQNISYHRMELKSKEKLTIFINEWRHLRGFYDEAEKEGKSLPIAIVIGADSVHYIAAGLRYDGDEIDIAGAMRGEAIKVVKCLTSDIYVPATAEFIIEAEVLPEYREIEGPLGEFTGHYS